MASDTTERLTVTTQSLLITVIHDAPAARSVIFRLRSNRDNQVRDFSFFHITWGGVPVKRILFVSPAIPREHGSGWEIRAWSHLSALMSLGPVTLIILRTTEQERKEGYFDYVEAARLSSVHTIPLRTTLAGFKSKIPLLSLVIRLIFIAVPRREPVPASLSGLNDALSEEFDIAVMFRLRAFGFYRKMSGAIRSKKLIVDFDDIESLVLSRQMAVSGPGVGLESRVCARLERLKTTWEQRLALKKANLVTVCSPLDMGRLKQDYGADNVAVFPNCVSAQKEHLVSSSRASANLLFLGTLSFPPNKDGVLFFVNEILPLIKNSHEGEFSVKIVGRNPPGEFLALKRLDNLEIVGPVDDVSDSYVECAVVIVPIRFGGGTRLKIIEAMSYGCAIVSTSIGAEGLDLTHGNDIMIADTAEEFATICVALLNDEERRRSLGQRALETYQARLECKGVRKNFAERLSSV